MYSSERSPGPAAWMPASFDDGAAAPRAVAWDDFAPAFEALPAGGAVGGAADPFGVASGRTSGSTPGSGRVAADDTFATALPDFAVVAQREAAHGAHPGTGTLIASLEARAAEREAALRAEFAATLAARAEADAARQQEELAQAWAEGHATGCAEGEAAAHEALAAVAATLEAAREQLAGHEARWLANLQENVAALAVAVARHVVEREVAADTSCVQAVAARAVGEFSLDEPLTLRVHPADLPALRAAMAGATAAAPPARELRWMPDAQIVRGGCVVEGRERIVDGRVDAALERIYRALSGHHA